MKPFAHTRITTIIVALCLTGPFATAQPHGSGHGSGHGFHVPMPNQQLALRCTFERNGETVMAEHPFKPVSSMAPADVDQPVRLTPNGPTLRIRRYLPQAQKSQTVVSTATTDGKPAIRLAITGRKQSFDRWLIADNPQRNRLTSLIGTWRYMAVGSDAERNDLYRQFEQELNRPAQVLIAGNESEPPSTLAAKVGETYTDKRTQQKLTVLRYLPHFGIDQGTKDVVNQSDERVNPAVLVELAHHGKKEQHWLFAKFPEFKSHGDAATPLRMRFDCPIVLQNAAPDLVVVTVARTKHEAWVRHEGAITSRSVGLKDKVPVPASSYVCAIEEFAPAGKLLESYDATNSRNAVTALRVDVPNAAGTEVPVWLELNKPRVVDSPQGALTLTFASQTAMNPMGH